jgi:hypothetical protein
MATQAEIRVQDIDHVGIIAGIIDEMGLVQVGRSFPPVLLPMRGRGGERELLTGGLFLPRGTSVTDL